MVLIEIIENIPTIIPRIVKLDLSLLTLIELSAILIISSLCIIHTLKHQPDLILKLYMQEQNRIRLL